jgi:hypothetical protein
MNWREAFGFVGAGLFLTGLFMWAGLFPRFGREFKESEQFGQVSGDIEPLLKKPTCNIELSPTTGTEDVTVDTSFKLDIIVKPNTATGCHSEVSVFGPAFDINPETQTFDLPDSKQKNFSFLLAPKKAGSQLVNVYADDREQPLITYSVRSYGYIPAWANPFIAPLVTVFGTMFTVPYWIEREQKKREAEAKKRAEEEVAKKKADAEARKRNALDTRSQSGHEA